MPDRAGRAPLMHGVNVNAVNVSRLMRQIASERPADRLPDWR
jgi:hypothetical protein